MCLVHHKKNKTFASIHVVVVQHYRKDFVIELLSISADICTDSLFDDT